MAELAPPTPVPGAAVGLLREQSPKTGVDGLANGLEGPLLTLLRASAP